MMIIELETGEQFEVRYQRVTSNKVALTVWTIEDVFGPQAQRIASFSWNELTGEIATVRVESDYRRRGIATALLQIANTYIPITHSADRNDAGQLWAESTGDELPPRNQY